MINSDNMWNGSVVVSKKSACMEDIQEQAKTTIIGDTETIQIEPIPASGPKNIMPLLPPSLIYDEEGLNLLKAFEYGKNHPRLKDHEQELELVDDWCHQELEEANKKIVCKIAASVIHDHTYHATSPPQLGRLQEQLREAEHAEKLRRKEAHKINERKRRAELREAYSIMQELLGATNATDNDTLLMAIDEIKTLEEQAEKKTKEIIRLERRHQELLNERRFHNIV